MTDTDSTVVHWRKRLDSSMLRWQARVETAGADNALPWLYATVLFVVLLLLALARSRMLEAGTGLATVSQSLWLIGEGFKPESSLLDGANYLARQGSMIMYPLALTTKILPTVTTLLVVQSMALAVGVVPLWRLARRVAKLRVGASTAIVFAYGVYSSVHNINLADFHPEVFAVPALLGAVLFGLREKWVRFSLMIVIILASRADLGLAVAGLGILLLVERNRKAGMFTALVGVAWTVTAIFLLQPAYAGGDFPHLGSFAAYGDGHPLDVVAGIITQPFDFLGDLLSQRNFRTMVGLLAPLLFLPVVAPRYLLPVVPLYSLYLVADVTEGTLNEAQQSVPVVAFVFVATVFAIQRTGTVLVERVNVDRRIIWALVFTASVFFVVDSGSSPYEEPWAWGRRDLVDEARLDAADLLPDDAAVRASPRVLPLISERERLFALDTTGPEGEEEAAVDRVDWVVFDVASAPQWDNLTIQQFDLGLGRIGWDRVFESEGVFVYQRGDEAPPTVVASPDS